MWLSASAPGVIFDTLKIASRADGVEDPLPSPRRGRRACRVEYDGAPLGAGDRPQRLCQP